MLNNSIVGPDISWLVPPGFKWNNKYKFDASFFLGVVVFFYLLEIDAFINLILCTFLMNMIILLEKTHFLPFIPNWYFKLRVILNTLVTAMVFIIVLITTSY